jgi:thiol-disulfide isomerase/thioredoxin
MGYETITSRREFSAALDRTEDSNNIIVIDCFTSWCPQCKAVQPKIDELNQEFGDEKNVFWCVFLIQARDIVVSPNVGGMAPKQADGPTPKRPSIYDHNETS